MSTLREVTGTMRQKLVHMSSRVKYPSPKSKMVPTLEVLDPWLLRIPYSNYSTGRLHHSTPMISGEVFTSVKSNPSN